MGKSGNDTIYRITGNFCEILIWQISEFFAKSPAKHASSRVYEHDTRIHVHNSAQRGRVQCTRIRQIKIRQ